MKNRGFILIETLVASTIILGALIFLFVQFSTIKKAYDTSFKYNTIPGLYNAKVMSTFLENHGYSEIDKALGNSTKDYVVLTSSNCHLYYENNVDIELCGKILNNITAKHVLYIGSNIKNLQKDFRKDKYDPELFDDGFRKFVLQIDPIEYKGRRRLLVEFKNETYAVIVIGADVS